MTPEEVASRVDREAMADVLDDVVHSWEPGKWCGGDDFTWWTFISLQDQPTVEYSDHKKLLEDIVNSGNRKYHFDVETFEHHHSGDRKFRYTYMIKYRPIMGLKDTKGFDIFDI